MQVTLGEAYALLYSSSTMREIANSAHDHAAILKEHNYEEHAKIFTDLENAIERLLKLQVGIL